MGVVTHQTLLYGDLSAEENLNFYARMFGLRNPKRIGQILEWTGLAARKRDLVRTFSRGMQQRLSIGRAILHEPQVLLLDEPHTGLDQEACDMLDGLLRDVAKNGSTVLLTSHDMTRVEYLAGRFDILSGGRIKASTMKTGLGGGNLLDFYRKVLAGAG
jgi:heme exporter protein A